VVSYHWTNTAIAVFYSVLSGRSGHLTSASQSSDSHLNATSFDCVNAWWVSPVSHTARLHLRVCFPTRKLWQDCRDSWDSLGTVLSETVVTVSLSAPPTIACCEQLAHSRTTGTIWSWSVTSTCFQLTTLALTPTDVHHPHRGAMSKKHRHRPSCKFLPP